MGTTFTGSRASKTDVSSAKVERNFHNGSATSTAAIPSLGCFLDSQYRITLCREEMLGN